MRVPKAGCQGRPRRARGQRPGIVLGGAPPLRMPGGDREKHVRRGVHRRSLYTGFVPARTRDRITFRERAEPARPGRRTSAGTRRRPGAIYFSVVATSGSIAAASTIMLALRGLLVIAACRVAAALPPAPARAVYDQRQTGDLNVQIELNDVQVVALLSSELLDDYTDYDYFYDYADFTSKPGNRPTTSPTTGTTEKNDIAQVSEPLSSQNSTISTSDDNTSPSASDTTPSKDEGVPDADPSNGTASDTTLSKDKGVPGADPSNGTASSTPSADNENEKSQPGEEEDGAGAAVVVPSITKPIRDLRQKRCRSGYVPNGNGRCRRASRPWLARLLP